MHIYLLVVWLLSPHASCLWSDLDQWHQNSLCIELMSKKEQLWIKHSHDPIYYDHQHIVYMLPSSTPLTVDCELCHRGKAHSCFILIISQPTEVSEINSIEIADRIAPCAIIVRC